MQVAYALASIATRLGVQDDLSQGSRSSVTSAIEAPVNRVNPIEADAASQLEAASEAGNTANAEAAGAKAAAKRAKKQRQKAKKQQEQTAHQLQQHKQPDARKQGLQQVPPQQASPLQSSCSAVSMDIRSSTTSAPAPAVAEAQQALKDELCAELPAASAAMPQCMPAEDATGTIPCVATGDVAVHAPQLQPETPETVCHEACSAQIQQTSPDSAKAASDALKSHRSQISAEKHALHGVSRACSQELPLCDRKQSFDTACMSGRGARLLMCDKQHIPKLLCCPITKVKFAVDELDTGGLVATCLAWLIMCINCMLYRISFMPFKSDHLKSLNHTAHLHVVSCSEHAKTSNECSTHGATSTVVVFLLQTMAHPT